MTNAYSYMIYCIKGIQPSVRIDFTVYCNFVSCNGDSIHVCLFQYGRPTWKLYRQVMSLFDIYPNHKPIFNPIRHETKKQDHRSKFRSFRDLSKYGYAQHLLLSTHTGDLQKNVVYYVSIILLYYQRCQRQFYVESKEKEA